MLKLAAITLVVWSVLVALPMGAVVAMTAKPVAVAVAVAETGAKPVAVATITNAPEYGLYYERGGAWQGYRHW